MTLRLVKVSRIILVAGVLAMAATSANGQPQARPRAGGEPPDTLPLSAQTISGWVVTALGGAAFISTVVTGALAIHKHQQLAVLCPHRYCEPALHADVDQFNAFRTAATASAIGAGLTGVLGVTLLLTAPERDGSPPQSLGLRLTPTAGGAALEGDF